MYPLIILDRDGVINFDSDNYIKSVSEFIPMASSVSAISFLKQANINIAIATNQSGISRGYYSLETMHQMHTKLNLLLHAFDVFIPPEDIFYCPHLPDEGCSCRKPLPGMIMDCLARFTVEPEQCLFVGDSFTDFSAAQSAHVDFALVRTGKGEHTLAQYTDILSSHSVPVYDNLLHLVQQCMPTILH